jgi:hypothetical protein
MRSTLFLVAVCISACGDDPVEHPVLATDGPVVDAAGTEGSSGGASGAGGSKDAGTGGADAGDGAGGIADGGLRSCRTQADCEVGRYCNFVQPVGVDVCGSVCWTGTDCASDVDCQRDGAAPDLVCEIPPKSPFCGPCSAKRCIAGCSQNDPCPEGQLCSAARHCEAIACDEGTTCPANFTCSGSSCLRTSCVTDADCGGTYCVLGECHSELATCFPPGA